MRNHLIFDRFGFSLPKTTTEKESKKKIDTYYDSWIYDSLNADWYREII